MKIAVVIETKDRRLNGGENYLGVTLQNLARAGVFSSPVLHSLDVVSGGELPDFFDREVYPCFGRDRINLHPCPSEGCTRQQNAARAIRIGGHKADADWVLKLEDDLDFVDDFLAQVEAWVLQVQHLPVPMFSLAATFEPVSQSRYQVEGESVTGPGASFPVARLHLAGGKNVLAHSVKGFWGAQALLWRRYVAAALADWLGPDPFLWDGREKHRARGHDLLLQVWGQKTGAQHFACAVPSFVQHIGRQSNLSTPDKAQPFFEFPWPGREWRLNA